MAGPEIRNKRTTSLTPRNPLKTSPPEYSSIASYGRPGVWLQEFQKKFLFLMLDNPSMPNTGTRRVFRYPVANTSDV
jgi:hypothetical protein